MADVRSKRPGEPGTRGAAGRLPALGAILIAGLLFGCSESHEPLDWREAVRGGLEAADSLVSDTMVVQTAHGRPEVSTGLSPYILTGSATRADREIRAELFMRWDVSGLPSGEVTDAHLEMYLAGVDFPDPVEAGDFHLLMHEVLGDWTEDSLVASNRPAPDSSVVIVTATVDSSGLAAGSNVLLLTNLFGGEDNGPFLELIAGWRDDEDENPGVMVRAGTAGPEGILRFFSAEGLPSGYSTPFLTPLLVVEVGDTTLSFEAIDDAFVVRPLDGAGVPGAVAIPDSLLLVSAGYTHRVALRFDLTALLGSSGDADLDLAVVRGVLRLHLEPGQPWSLPAGETLALAAYDAAIDWEAADPIASIELGEKIAGATVSGDEETVEIGIAPYLQKLVEGSGQALVLLANTEILEAQSVLFKDVQAETGRPEVEMSFVSLGGRLGP